MLTKFIVLLIVYGIIFIALSAAVIAFASHTEKALTKKSVKGGHNDTYPL